MCKKYVLIILDGVSDVPLAELGGETPLSKAYTPHLDYIAKFSQPYLLDTAYEDFPVESAICIMGILGYDPHLYYPSGRASFEALAQNIKLNSNDIAFRCNIVHASPDGNILQDFTADMISDTLAQTYLKSIKIPKKKWELYCGQSYRNLLILRDYHDINPDSLVCHPPHMYIGNRIKKILPYSMESNSKPLISSLNNFLLSSAQRITNPAYNCIQMLWVWSPSSTPSLPRFETLHHKKGAVVAGLDFMHGIAHAAGMRDDRVTGATGFLDTNYIAKRKKTCQLLNEVDFVVLHINSTDEAGHMRNGQIKKECIEKIDREVIGPMMVYLREQYGHTFRVAVCADHMTQCTDGKHIGAPTPCMIYSPTFAAQRDIRFTEQHLQNCRQVRAINFLSDIFFRRNNIC